MTLEEMREWNRQATEFMRGWVAHFPDDALLATAMSIELVVMDIRGGMGAKAAKKRIDKILYSMGSHNAVTFIYAGIAREMVERAAERAGE